MTASIVKFPRSAMDNMSRRENDLVAARALIDSGIPLTWDEIDWAAGVLESSRDARDQFVARQVRILMGRTAAARVNSDSRKLSRPVSRYFATLGDALGLAVIFFTFWVMWILTP